MPEEVDDKVGKKGSRGGEEVSEDDQPAPPKREEKGMIQKSSSTSTSTGRGTTDTGEKNKQSPFYLANIGNDVNSSSPSSSATGTPELFLPPGKIFGVFIQIFLGALLAHYGHVTWSDIIFAVSYSMYLLSANYIMFDFNYTARRMATTGKEEGDDPKSSTSSSVTNAPVKKNNKKTTTPMYMDLFKEQREPWFSNYMTFFLLCTIIMPLALVSFLPDPTPIISTPASATTTTTTVTGGKLMQSQSIAILQHVFMLWCQIIMETVTMENMYVHNWIRLLVPLGFSTYRMPLVWKWFKVSSFQLCSSLLFLLLLIQGQELQQQQEGSGQRSKSRNVQVGEVNESDENRLSSFVLSLLRSIMIPWDDEYYNDTVASVNSILAPSSTSRKRNNADGTSTMDVNTAMSAYKTMTIVMTIAFFIALLNLVAWTYNLFVTLIMRMVPQHLDQQKSPMPSNANETKWVGYHLIPYRTKRKE